jgi:hypothetical protein
MQKHKDRPRPIVLPVRLSLGEYAELAALAALDQRTRCAMVRKLIAEMARRSVLSLPTKARGGHDAA